MPGLLLSLGACAARLEPGFNPHVLYFQWVGGRLALTNVHLHLLLLLLLVPVPLLVLVLSLSLLLLSCCCVVVAAAAAADVVGVAAVACLIDQRAKRCGNGIRDQLRKELRREERTTGRMSPAAVELTYCLDSFPKDHHPRLLGFKELGAAVGQWWST